MKFLKFTFLLVKYRVPTILIARTNLLRIKCLSVKFSKYQKQPSGGVLTSLHLLQNSYHLLQNSLKNIKNIRDAVFNLKFQTKGLQLY